MLKRNIFLLNLSVFTLLLSSCSVMMQRPYIATSPNLNCFDRSNEKNVKLSLFVNHYDLQSNFVLSKNFGLSLGIDGAFKGQIGGEIAGIFYNRLNDKHYIELQYGYGYFYHNSTIDNKPWDAGALIEYGQHYSQDINTNYHKLFIQPTYFYKLRKVNFGFGLKISANYFDNYHYHYYLHDDSKGDYDFTDSYSTANFKNKWNFVFEPVFKVEFKRKLFIQLSAIFSNNIFSSAIYQDHNKKPVSRVITGELDNPQHLDFLFTIGYEFRFGKKKKE